MSELAVLREFQENFVAFFDELIDQFPEEGDLVLIRVYLKDQIPIHKVVTEFGKSLSKDDNALRKMVKARNENFFLEHNMFDTFGKDKVNHFKRMWRAGKFDDDKETIWQWIDGFIFLYDKYVRIVNSRDKS